MKPELLKLLDELRRSPRGMDAEALTLELGKRSFTVNEDDIRAIIDSRDGGGFIPPKRVVEFVMQLAIGRKISTALDFGCGVVGFVGRALEVQKATVTAITQVSECAALSRLLCKGTKVDVACDDPLAWLERTKFRFDFVFGLPPWGFKSGVRLPTQEASTSRRINAVIPYIAWAGSRLTDDGIGVFVVPDSFASNQLNPPTEILSKCGLNLVSYLSLPTDSFRPHTAALGGLAVVARKGTGRFFVGALSSDSKRNEVLFRNFNAGREGRDVGTGRFVQLADFRGVRALEAQEQNDRIAARLGLESTPLQDILVAVNFAKSNKVSGFEEQPSAVYLPLIGRSNAVTSTEQFRIQPHSYVQLLVNPAMAVPDYLAGFFNTPLGLLIREQSISGPPIPKETRVMIDLMKVYLPPLDIQRKSVETHTRILNISVELRELEKRLWDQPMRCDAVAKATERFERKETLPAWIDTLPFPLGSILWAYHTCGADDKVRYEHLLHFFEAYGEFLATILLSVVSRDKVLFADELKRLGEVMAEQKLSLRFGTFGTWKCIVERLAKTCRTLLTSAREMKEPQKRTEALERVYEMFCTHDDEAIEALTSSGVVSLLQKTNSRRNSWTGHGGMVGGPEAKARHVELQTYLAELRECIRVSWERFELVLPGAATFTGGIHRYSVERVCGCRTPFEKVENVELTHTMEHDVLHLKGKDERSAFALLPLIKMMSSPRFAENACYFYNRQERGGIRFVSYHFDKEADVTDVFADTLQVISELNIAIGQPNKT